MYLIYSLLLFLWLCAYLPVYFFRSKLRRGGSLNLAGRLGRHLDKAKTAKNSLWIHAVSVGEVLSLQNLTRKIKERHPGWVIHFSTLTPTGINVAREKLTDVDNIFFVPLDFKRIVEKYFKHLQAKAFILVESEFWPNLIQTAKKNSCPVLLVNGRFSPRSCRRYKKIRFLFRRILQNIDYFLVQTEKEKNCLQDLGVALDRVEVTGNLKSDTELPEFEEKDLLDFKKNLGIPEGKKVVLAGSTRNGEEGQLLKAFSNARKLRNDLLFIIAPRHLKRTAEIERICREFALQAARRTSLVPGLAWDVLILDTIGELAWLYSVCDLAFIGGSLVSWGGQNLLEPAFYAKPIFFGPHMENFSHLAERFCNAGAAKVVSEGKDLVSMFLFQDERQLAAMGRRAKEMLTAMQGPTSRTIQVIESYLADF